jgi:hypothetical protein
MLFHNDPINLIIKKEKLNKKFPLLFEDKLSLIKDKENQSKLQKIENVYLENKLFNKTLLHIYKKKESLAKVNSAEKDKLIKSDFERRILNFSGRLSSNDCFYNEKNGRKVKRKVIHPSYKIHSIKFFDYQKFKADEYFKIVQPIDESKFFNKIGGFDYFCYLKGKYLKSKLK